MTDYRIGMRGELHPAITSLWDGYERQEAALRAEHYQQRVGALRAEYQQLAAALWAEHYRQIGVLWAEHAYLD